MRHALVALLFVGSFVAGCLGGSDAGITAKDAVARSESRAREWQGDAQPVALAGAEMRGDLFEMPGFSVRMEEDPNVGDGRATAWQVLWYSAGANATFVTMAFRNGTVLAAGSDYGPGPQMPKVPLARWEVDSTRAVEIARADAEFQTIVEAADARMFLVLAMPDAASDPVWSVHAESRERGRFAIATLGARAGDVLNRVTGDRNFTIPPIDPPPPQARVLQFQGTVDAVRPRDSHSFEVGPGDRTLEVSFQYGGSLPTDSAQFSILLGGSEIAPTTSQASGRVTYARYDLRAPGAYELSVRLSSSAPLGSGVSATYQAMLTIS